MVVIPSEKIDFSLTSINNSCKPLVYIFEQPATPITAATLNTLIAQNNIENPVDAVHRAEISVYQEGRATVVEVSPQNNTLLLNNQIVQAFRTKGVVVSVFNSSNKANLKNVVCGKSGCDKGFTMRLPYAFDAGAPGAPIKRIDFPIINENTSYEIKFSNCYTDSGNDGGKWFIERRQNLICPVDN